MNSRDVRRGVTQAKFNDKNINILSVEIFIIAVIFGVGYESWIVFGGVFLGLIYGMKIKPLAIVFCYLFGIIWGIIGYIIGMFIGSHGASISLGIIGLIVGIKTHLSAIEWVKDLNNP